MGRDECREWKKPKLGIKIQINSGAQSVTYSTTQKSKSTGTCDGFCSN